MSKYWWGKLVREEICIENWNLLWFSKEERGFGFCNLEVLFVKQFWYIYCNFELFLSCVFKVRYFFLLDLWFDEIGYLFNYVWCSLMGVCQVLEKGVRWMIGDGIMVRIWGDCWVLSNVEGKVLYYCFLWDLNFRVCNFFDWDL